MSDINRTGMTLATETDQFSVASGGTLEIPVILENQSASSDQVRITVEGVPLAWVSPASGHLAGFAGCNDYNGRYTAADNGDEMFAVAIDRLTIGSP